eukprot:6467480-Amphidinium_carterae.1
MEHPGPAHATIQWLLDRDMQTRAKARCLHQEKYPWAEALRVARETHLAVLWTSTGVGVSHSAPQQVTPSDVHVQKSITAKQPQSGGAPPGQNSLPTCAAFNSAR